MAKKPVKLAAAPDPVNIEAEVLELLDRHRTEIKLLKAVTGLHERHGDAIYPPLLYAFSHLRFSKPEATKHYAKIIAHKAKLGKKVGRTVDVRVALLDYFLSQHKRIEQPKIIELWAFQRTLQSAVTDELTGLYNYRFGREALARELKRAERHREMVSVFLFDLDNFKRVNDLHGHLFGNEVLVEVAGMIRRAMRDTDLAVRFGGEEFLIILPGTPKDGALNLAERLRQQLSRHEFRPAPRIKARVTLSGGIATFPNDGQDASQLIKRADQALYTIKAGDKNGVALFSREQRTFTRVEAAVLGYFRLVGEESAPLETVNLSMSGLLFTSDVRLPAGATLEIGLNLPDAKPAVPIKARVVRCAERQGRFEIAATIQQVRHPWQKKLSEFLEKKAG